MNNLLKAIKLDHRIVRSVLQNAEQFDDWSLQGFGMLRLYLGKDIRIHVWDDRFAVPNVSLLHDHPWDFESYIVAGKMINYRYLTPAPGRERTGDPFMFSKIQCGPGGGRPGGGMRSEPEFTSLVELSPELYLKGNTYHQAADEIHKSVPERGTVTVVERTFRPDTEHARVFWPAGTNWVSAEPRMATYEEVRDITQYALQQWFEPYDI